MQRGNSWTLTLKLYGKACLSFSLALWVGGFINGARSSDSLDSVTVCSWADQACYWCSQFYSCITQTCRRSTTDDSGNGLWHVQCIPDCVRRQVSCTEKKQSCLNKNKKKQSAEKRGQKSAAAFTVQQLLSESTENNLTEGGPASLERTLHFHSRGRAAGLRAAANAHAPPTLPKMCVCVSSEFRRPCPSVV